MRIAVLVFGAIPATVLGLLALLPLSMGLAVLLDFPTQGALLIAWAVLGLIGSVALLRATAGRATENTTLGLLAGITAAAPLALLTVTELSYPLSLVWGYWTICPIVVALWLLVERR